MNRLLGIFLKQDMRKVLEAGIFITTLMMFAIFGASLSFSQDQEPFDVARMSIGVMGGGGTAAAAKTAFCTAATTCTATNPGQCDVYCEDFDNPTSHSCYASYDNNCWNTGSYLTCAGAGDSIDFTSTASGTYPCANTTNTNVMLITVSAAARACYHRMSLTGPTAWTQLYFNVSTGTFGSDGNLVPIVSVLDTSGNKVCEIRVTRISGAGDIHIQAKYYNSSDVDTTVSSTTTVLSVGTWYRLNMNHDNAGNAVIKINGTTEITIADLTTTRAVGRWKFGPDGENSIAYTLQLDNITIDDDTEPGVCL
jgi:hypothetical protein